MSLNFINKALSDNRVWVAISIFSMLLLLSPLLFNGGEFYVPVFDNLDSTVVWYKILAQSGMIFADNSATIPNMMSGLPRSSYFSEFDVLLWLYYFFEPKTAFVINEVTIHLVAFFSMYVFLKKYIVKKKNYYHNIPTFVGALYFSLLPYWSGAGLSIAIAPLVTYALLNIKNYQSSRWDWTLLVLLPLYTSFIFLYMFYIVYAGLFLVWITLREKKLNRALFGALFLMGTLFLLSEYRLVYAMFVESGFVSHRSEFNIFFTHTLLEAYEVVQLFFLVGHYNHVSGLQSIYILPIIIIAALLSLSNKRFAPKESMLIWVLIFLSFYLVEFWDIVLRKPYSLPILIAFFLYIALFSKQNKILGTLFLFQVVTIFVPTMLQLYQGFAFIAETFPTLKGLNIVRMAFIQPLLNAVLLVYALMLISKKLSFSNIFATILILLQLQFSLVQSFYYPYERKKYASFEQYYAPEAFSELKSNLSLEGNPYFILYGMESAVALYNGLYTLGGYSTNYPLEYKQAFLKIFETPLTKRDDLYTQWGSKLYMNTPSHQLRYYRKWMIRDINVRFNKVALCKLNPTYLLSPYSVNPSILREKNMTHVKTVYGHPSSWDLYLYRLNCQARK
jgi:hypothetical protein